jgi:tetratricopeptide (TPR) repeat protein
LASPVLFLLLLECGLRSAGYGYETDFIVKIRGRESYMPNEKFGWRFFPPTLARTPQVWEVPARRTPDTIRVYVLGGSAALGEPEPAYSFGSFLEVLLQDRYPDTKFEVVNAAMTAINSHVVLPIARDCARHHPDLFVLYMGNNEVIGPYGSGTVFTGFTNNLSWIRANIGLKATRTGQWIDSFFRNDAGSQAWGGMKMFLDNQVTIDDPRMEKMYSHFRGNLEEIYRVTTRAGAKILVSTVSTNLKDNPPFAAANRSDLSEEELEEWESLFKRGVALVKQKDLTGALKRFRQAEEIDGGNANLAYRIAQCHLFMGQLNQARVYFEKARDLDTLRFRADSNINRIIRETAANRMEDGIALVDSEKFFIDEALKRNTLPGTRMFFEHAHFKPLGNYLLARNVFEAMLPLLPESVRKQNQDPVRPLPFKDSTAALAMTPWDSYQMRLRLYDVLAGPPFSNQLDHGARVRQLKRRLKELKEEWTTPESLVKTRRSYEAALTLRPEDLDLRRRFTFLLLEQKDYPALAAQFEMLVNRIPGVSSWRLSYGQVLNELGLYERATQEFREAARLNPQYEADVYFDLGRIHIRQEEYEEAETHLRNALAIDPGMLEAQLSLSSALIGQKLYEEGIRTLRDLLESKPDSFTARYLLADALELGGDLLEAALAYEEAADLRPRHFEARMRWAAVLEKLGRWDEAIAQYEAAVALESEDVNAWMQLGEALRTAKRFQEATKAFGRALKIEPDNEAARRHLAEL